MAITNAFKLAELVRHLTYNSTDDVIETSKKMHDKNAAMFFRLLTYLSIF